MRARLGPYLIGLWLASFASMCTGAETAATEDQRIVSVGGELTEIVYALGAEARLIGVDTTSQWPAATLVLPKVGYMRTLSAEAILSQPGIELICTGRNRRLVVMDGLYLLGFGPRLGEAITDLAQALREPPSACTPCALRDRSARGAHGG